VVNRDLWEMLEEKMRELEGYGTQAMFWKIPKEWNEAGALAKAATVSTHSLGPWGGLLIVGQKLEKYSTKLAPLHIIGGYDGVGGAQMVLGADFNRALEAGDMKPTLKFQVVKDL